MSNTSSNGNIIPVIRRSLSNLKWLSPLHYNIIKLRPEFKSFRLRFIKIRRTRLIFGIFNKAVRLFDYLKHRSRIRIANFVCMNLNKKEVNICRCIIIKPFYSTSVFFSRFLYNPYNYIGIKS